MVTPTDAHADSPADYAIERFALATPVEDSCFDFGDGGTMDPPRPAKKLLQGVAAGLVDVVVVLQDTRNRIYLGEIGHKGTRTGSAGT